MRICHTWAMVYLEYVTVPTYANLNLFSSGEEQDLRLTMFKHLYMVLP